MWTTPNKILAAFVTGEEAPRAVKWEGLLALYRAGCEAANHNKRYSIVLLLIFQPFRRNTTDNACRRIHISVRLLFHSSTVLLLLIFHQRVVSSQKTKINQNRFSAQIFRLPPYIYPRIAISMTNLSCSKTHSA